jgi:hypothetical protein
VLGGSDARNLAIWSKVDYGVSYHCPYGTLSANYTYADVGIQPVNPNLNSITDIPNYVINSAIDNFNHGSVGCRSFTDGAGNPPANPPDDCYATATLNYGYPGHSYVIFGDRWDPYQRAFTLWLPSGVTWSSYPSSACRGGGGNVLVCNPPNQYVTGF